MKSINTGISVRIWDIWVRTFHWLLAVSVGFLLLSGKTGFMFIDWHRNAGEFVLALLLFRLVWGIVGSSNARLSSLIHHPRNAITHLIHLMQGKVAQERGHNAAGSWAVVVLILLLAFQAISGQFIADEDELIEGAFYGAVSSGLTDRLLDLHYTVADLLMIMVGLHVVMVFVYLLRAGQNLITPMLTGRMRWLEQATPPSVHFIKNVYGLIVFAICFGLVGLLLGWLG